MNLTKLTKKELIKEIERLLKIKSSGDWIDIPELNISVEREVHDKNKNWEELKLSNREDELLTAEECIWLANSKYSKELKMDGLSSEDDFFIKQPFDLNRKNDYITRFDADSGRSYLYCCRDPQYSYSSAGVRFVRRKKKPK